MWTTRVVPAAVLLAAVAGCSSASNHKVTLPHRAPHIAKPWVTTSGTRFVDQAGNPVVLRGVDVGVVDQAVYAQASALDANLVRIPVAWSIVERQAPDGSHHHWHTGTLQALDAEVAYFRDHHVNVLIDFHQFHWSPYFAKVECKTGASACLGTGVPRWYYADGRFPDTKLGESDAKKAFWTSEASRSEDAYAAFAAMMATRYAVYPNVIGYEIFNEPHPGALGDSTSATDTMLGWQAQIRRVIRAVDPTRTVFVMCRGGGEGVGTASLKAFGSLDHLALDYHDYFNGVPGIGLTPDGNDWTPSWAATHNQRSTAYVGTEDAQAKVLAVPLQRTREWRIPLLVGEWGIHTGDNGADIYQQQMLDLFARDDISWTRWNLARGGGFALLQGTGSPTAEALQLRAAMQGP